MNVSFFLEMKEEYTQHLIDTLAPYIYEGLTSIYKEAVKVANDSGCEEKILITFQKCLQAIGKWNQLIIAEETNRIKQLSNTADYLDDLVKAVIKSNIILLTFSNNISNIVAQTFYNSFTTQTFIHRCYAECGKDAHNYPYLFYHDVNPMDFKRNQIVIQQNIQSGITRAIRKVLPISLILKEYLVNSINIIQEPPKVELIGAHTNPANPLHPLEANMGVPNFSGQVHFSDKQKMDPQLEKDVMELIKSEGTKSNKDKIQALMHMEKFITSIEAPENKISSSKKSPSGKRIIDRRHSDLMVAPHLIDNESDDRNDIDMDNFGLGNSDKNILNINIDEEETVEGNTANKSVSGTSLSSRAYPGKSGPRMNPETSERIDPSKVRPIEEYGSHSMQMGGNRNRQRRNR